MQTIILDGTWQEVGTGLTSVIVSTTDTTHLYIGATAPVLGSRGLKMVSKFPYNVPNLSTFGGGLWVRGKAGGAVDVVIA